MQISFEFDICKLVELENPLKLCKIVKCKNNLNNIHEAM